MELFPGDGSRASHSLGIGHAHDQKWIARVRLRATVGTLCFRAGVWKMVSYPSTWTGPAQRNRITAARLPVRWAAGDMVQARR